MKPSRTGTFDSFAGQPQTTLKNHAFRARLAGFAVAVSAFALLIVWIDSNIWRVQSRLEGGMEEIKAERFYLGVNFRDRIRELRQALLDFLLSGDSAELELFRSRSRELADRLQAGGRNPVSPGEKIALGQLSAALAEFRRDVDALIKTRLTQTGPEDFWSSYTLVRRCSQPMVEACNKLMEAERNEFDVFLQNSERTLLSLQRLFLFSLLLLVALAAALAVLVFRGMIAPLRAQLSESQLIIERQEKLASLGALGAGVAHEIRNPLTAIKFRLFSLKKSLPPEWAENEDARIISEEISRLDRIVKDFLQFARPSEPERVPVPAERMLREVHGLLQSQLAQARIALELEISQPAWVRADTNQIKQVLINLVQNSADSIERDGTIRLQLHTRSMELAGRGMQAVILGVSDTGPGIPPEARKRLFDPFFTTKEGGTGLGLAIAARIAEKHGGLLRYQTQTQRGTTFELVLPGMDDHVA